MREMCDSKACACSNSQVSFGGISRPPTLALLYFRVEEHRRLILACDVTLCRLVSRVLFITQPVWPSDSGFGNEIEHSPQSTSDRSYMYIQKLCGKEGAYFVP